MLQLPSKCRGRYRLILVALACGVISPVRAEDEWADQVANALTFSSAQGDVHAQVSGLMSVTAFSGQQTNPGLVFTENDTFASPRLTLFLDGQIGSRVTGFVQARVDRGFDPGDGSAHFRLDEYALRYALVRGSTCNLQIGKFATMIGNWVARHDEWLNPFVNAPLPYEYLSRITDESAPVTPQDLAPPPRDEEYEHLPIVWGPSYATGLSVSGLLGRFDYAAEVKNAGPSSRPDAWTLGAVNFAHPAYNVRVGFRPDMRFKFGLSVSDSMYLLPSAFVTIPPGSRPADYREVLWGQDFSYEWHHFQLWAELFEASFEMPRLGTARTIAGYVEMRYKLSPRISAALRLNRQVFSTIENAGVTTPTGTNMNRVDLAMAFCCTSHSHLKLQVSAKQAAGELGHPHCVYAMQYILRF